MNNELVKTGALDLKVFSSATTLTQESEIVGGYTGITGLSDVRIAHKASIKG